MHVIDIMPTMLKEHGVRAFSVLEKLDDSPKSIILESVLEGMTEYYRKNLAREVRKGLKENALSASPAPLCFNIINGDFIINADEPIIIRKISELALLGKGYSYIID